MSELDERDVVPAGLCKAGGAPDPCRTRRFADLVWRIVGADARAWSGPGLGEPGCAHGDGAPWAKDALFTLSLSIAGGTNEIRRSIIGERVLGLPRAPS